MKKLNYSILILFLLLLVGCKQEKNLHLLKESYVIELGDEISLNAMDYLDISKIKESKLKEMADLDITLNVTEENYLIQDEKRYLNVGLYSALIVYKNEKVEFEIEVKDTISPTLSGLSSIQIAKGDWPNIESYFSAQDLNELDPLYFDDSQIQKDVVGDYTLYVTSKDKAGNETKIEVALQVIDKLENDQVSYRQHDDQLLVSITNSLVKFDHLGNKSVLLDTPFYNQFVIGAPVGCEAVSLYMALRYKGYVSNMEVVPFISTTPRSPDDNPYNGFVGTVFDQHRYDILPAIFPSALTPWANQYGKAMDISGQGAEEVVNQLLNGNPVVIWITAYFNEPEWQYFDWGKGFKNTHTVCAIGYDEASQTLYYHDPGMGPTKTIDFNAFKYIYEIQNFGVSIL